MLRNFALNAVFNSERVRAHRSRRLSAAAAGGLARVTELLEPRVLLSVVPVADRLAGPVTSAATQAWYYQRIAALQSLHSTQTPTPDFQIARRQGNAPQQVSAPDSAGLSPTQLDKYYGFSGLTFGSVPANGKGQTIAVVDAYNDPNITKDLATFDKDYGLAAPPSFKVVSQTGSTSKLPSDDTADPINGSWASEESLDVEWAHALAPGANIIAVECDSQSDADLYAGVAYAASAPGVSMVSMSFGESEANYTQSQVAAIDPTFATPSGHQNVTFLASSGDDGAYSDNGPLAVSYPSSSPYVLAVGGTTIKVNSSGNPESESAWSGSGGGVSTLESQTAAQKAAVGSYSGRAAPDVAFDADPNSGVYICDSFDFGSSTPFEVFGGTSFSSPAWAAILAIANQGRVINGQSELDGRAQTIPYLYSSYTDGNYSSFFNDITSGNNGYYNAGTGYDLTTGLGSPKLSKLIPALAGITGSSTPPTISALSISPPVEDAGTSITMTASGVSDVLGTVSGVNFYSVKGATSTLVGAGKLGSSGNWALTLSTTGLAAGTYTYTAVATNSDKQSSAAVSATNKVVVGQATPTIGSFTISPGSDASGSNITLSASSVADSTSTIASVVFYLQSGSTQTLIGNGVSAGSGKWTLTSSTLGLTPAVYTYLAVATAASGLVSKTATATNTVTQPAALTIVVNTSKDQTDAKGSTTISLRDAIAIADESLSAVTINFSSSVFGKFQTITLSGPTLSLTNTKASIAINGPTAGIAISGHGKEEILSISSAVKASLSNLTLTDGLSGGNGGALINAGTTVLTNVTVSKNTLTGFDGNGGGIENDGTLTLVDSTVTGNSAPSGAGGGIYNTGKLTLTQSTISGNSAGYDGGGIDNSYGASSTVTTSTISGNKVIDGNGSGGGIENDGTLTLTSSTISGNSCKGNGGGVDNAYGSLTMVNCTLVGNKAVYTNSYAEEVGYGGGLYDSGTATLTNDTLTQNTANYGGGIDIGLTGTLTIANTIVSGNTATATQFPPAGTDVLGTVDSKGHNLIGVSYGSYGWVSSDFTGTVSSPINAKLSSLGNNGGPTETVVPETGSLAIGNGSVGLIPKGVTTDQRGKPRTINGKVDIGAVEV